MNTMKDCHDLCLKIGDLSLVYVLETFKEKFHQFF